MTGRFCEFAYLTPLCRYSLVRLLALRMQADLMLPAIWLIRAGFRPQRLLRLGLLLSWQHRSCSLRCLMQQCSFCRDALSWHSRGLTVPCPFSLTSLLALRIQ